MADKEVLTEPPESRNYKLVQDAFMETAKELHEYVDKTLKIIHEDVYVTCSKYIPCSAQCSETCRDTYRWCKACQEWKKHLSKYIRPRGRRVYWDKMRSWEWPQDYRELGRVFGPQYWKKGTLNDLPTYLEIIKSCKKFKLPKTVLDQVKEIKEARNNYTGHNPTSQISEDVKNRVFDMLNKFIATAEISREIKSSTLLQMLSDIQMGKTYLWNPDLNQIKNVESQKHDAKSGENGDYQLQITSNRVETHETSASVITYEVQGRSRDDSLSYRTVALAGIFTVLIFVGLFTRTGKDSFKGCLTEDFSYPLGPDIYLSHYIKEHTKIVGREWLLWNISDTVFHKQFESTGILLLAEMGFGKSALISHIVCAESKEPGGELRSRLLAYHVCRFDALNTKRAAIFIRRLAGMIANSIPQFGSALATSSVALSHLNSTECNFDPVGCMDQSIVYTLSKVESNKGRILIIVIDALDECEDADANKNEILSVLESTAHRFPKWIKFICTSRNIPTMVWKLRDFLPMEISPNDNRNKRDIQDFVSKFVYEDQSVLDKSDSVDIPCEMSYGNYLYICHAVEYLKSMNVLNLVSKYVNDDQSSFQKLSSTFMMDNKSDIVDRLCEMSSGNFLYIRHALEYLKSTDVLSVENIPNTLEKIYQLNFERIYGKTEERFHWARIVLEILCASTEPLKKETIFDMLRFESTNMSKNTFNKEMHTLMHFVRSDERLFFTHISMYYWLTDVTREGMTYFIEKEVGHNLIARYLFHLVKESNNDSDENIINLALHVSESKRQDLISYFKSLPRRFFSRRNESGSLLHKLAKSLNSYLATELCLYFIKDVDILNADSITPAFIAAGRGNIETLKALVDAGANITFRMPLPKLFLSIDDAALITKTRTFWGYGLLDIAAQHGHVDTILLLLNRSKNMADLANEMNVKAHHLACEFGQIKVLDIFLKLSPRFADQRCLYKAASNAHSQIVQRLLTFDAQDVCLPCNGRLYWLGENESRMQSPFLKASSSDKYNLEYVNETLSKRKPFDDWWTVSCETALHASSRLGFTDIVRILISRTQNAIECRDRAGRTPFLTAVIHNRTDIVELLYPLANASNKCVEWNLTQEEFMHLNHIEINTLSEGKCSNGSTVVHLIARYGLTNLAEHSLFRDMDWKEEDNEGCRPIHHAACHAGLNMLKYLVYVRKVDIFSRTKNGSTAFHMAALCRPYNLYVLYVLNSEKMPQLFDNFNRSILQHIYMHPLSSDSSYALNRISEVIWVTRHIIFSQDDITHIDLTGSNLLHYVMKHGYFDAIPYMYNKSQDIFFKRILETDNFKKRPLDEAFSNLPYDERIVRIPYNCSMNEVISQTCDGVNINDYIQYMSPIELSIFFFVDTVRLKTENHLLFNRYVHEAIKRSNVYVTLMFLMYLPANSSLGNGVYNPLTTFASIGNNPIMANLFLVDGCDCLKCGVPIEQSPLHQISLNMNNSFWFVNSKRVHAIVKGLSVEYIKQCVDTEGFNVLHRAIEGGNHELAKYYTERGLSITKHSILNHVLLGAMAKFSMPNFNKQPYELQFFNRTKHLHSKSIIPVLKTDYDVTTFLVLRHASKANLLTYNEICQNSKATLSLVHLTAANGLLKSLKYIAKKWGKKALVCQNADLLSPIYLAYVFNQLQVIRYLEEQNITLIYPKRKTELYLSFVLFFDVNKLHQRKRHCLRSFLRCVNTIIYSPHNYFVLVRASNCLKVIPCSDLLPESAYQLKNTQKLMSFLVRKKIDILHLEKDASNSCKTVSSRRCTLDFPYLRPATGKVQALLKMIIPLVFQLEIYNPKLTLYAMKWLFNRYSNIRQRFNSTKHHEDFETVASLIEPVLGKKFLYLRKLTLIGRYNELRTISTMVQNRLNIHNAQLSFELPRIKMDVFKSLYDLFSSEKQNNS